MIDIPPAVRAHLDQKRAEAHEELDRLVGTFAELVAENGIESAEIGVHHLMTEEYCPHCYPGMLDSLLLVALARLAKQT